MYLASIHLLALALCELLLRLQFDLERHVTLVDLLDVRDHISL